MAHIKRGINDCDLFLYNTVMEGLKRWIFMVVVLFTATTIASCQEYSSDVSWLINVLDLEEGSVVADIGAGDGDQALAIARHVGPSGKVYSSELGTEDLQDLREAVESASVDNVTVVEGHPTQTNLPEECCDALYLRRVYHHFGDPASMNKSLYRTLKPGGRLAVIDFEPTESESEDPDGRATGSQHGVTADTVVEELRQAGFVLVSSKQPSGRGVYVVMEKPDGN